MVIPPLQGRGIWRMILQRILRLLTNIGCGLFHFNISVSWICNTHAHKLNKVVSKFDCENRRRLVISVLLKSRSLRMGYQIVFYCYYRRGRSSFVLFSLLEVVILLMC
ncbi:hypothetical protein Hanom_Chr08g00747041 [Helianthus anomalus]